ncbi:MAG TPA: 16S rRNA (guanine(966)-N(2))-methyltransferase RsmD [Candidatus Pelagibacter sp.]|jgi:16S rRNA (guanine966-N2)-methyltransferase|nr:16S rRNA (guanine(966)-N(2))-methyltransferase RsmD [Candidatus Pelagibacter sp.]
MRIISGNLKGSTLYLPESKKTRPLKDMARESIFNLLTHSKKITFELKDSNILDLYAGTGSFGLECLSRGSKKVCFVEKSKDVLKILEKNIEKLKLKEKTKVFNNDVFILIKKKNIFDLKFNLIFCDPPFINKDTENIIDIIFNNNILENEGIIILHRNKNSKDKYPKYFKIIDERIYGVSKIIFGKILF